jgi:hypothetical protein
MIAAKGYQLWTRREGGERIAVSELNVCGSHLFKSHEVVEWCYWDIPTV